MDLPNPFALPEEEPPLAPPTVVELPDEVTLASDAASTTPPKQLARPSSAKHTPSGTPSLYERAKQLELKKKELTKLLHQECTFSPKVNRRPDSARRQQAAATGDGTPLRGGASGSGSTPSAGAGGAAEEGTAEAAEAGTRSPSGLSTTSSSVLRSSSTDAGDRLYRAAVEQAARHKAAEAQRRPGCTFKPVITGRAAALRDAEKAAHAAPVGEQLYEKAKESRQKQEAWRMKAALDGCTFSPQLTKKARSLQRPGSAVARLYDPSKVAGRKDEPAVPAECTFKPTINSSSALRKGSVSAATGGSDAGSGSGAVTGSDGLPIAHPASAAERLYLEAERKRLVAEARAKAHEALQTAECRPKPDVTASMASAKKLLGISVQHMDSETTAIHDRLYAKALDRKLQVEKTVAKAAADAEAAVDPECTFEPAISNMSRLIMEQLQDPALAGVPRYELLYEEARQRAIAATAAAHNPRAGLSRSDMAECTFMPNAARPDRSLTSFAVHDRLAEARTVASSRGSVQS